VAPSTYSRWIFEDPVARKIRLELREDGHEGRRAALTKLVVGIGAATSTFLAGVKVFDLGATVLQITHVYLVAPLMSALTVL